MFAAEQPTPESETRLITPKVAHPLDGKATEITVDTPTSLFILSCHVSLLGISNQVFVHLDRYIHSLPNSHPSHAKIQSFYGLQFEELQPSNDACAKTRAAFSILMNALDHIEGILGLPTDLRFAQSKMTLKGDFAEGENYGTCSEDESGCNEAIFESQSLSIGLVSIGLAESVLSQESLVPESKGGGGLVEVRVNINRLKWTLRQKMAH